MLNKKDTLNIALLAIITVIFFWQILITPQELLACGDLLSDSVYSSSFMHKTFQDTGERALWNPYFFAGKPHAAHIEYGQYYPTSLGFLFNYQDHFLNFVVIAHFFLAGLFMYMFLKNLKIKRTGSTIGAIAFMLGGNFLNLLMGDVLPIVAYSYIPLIFLGFEKLLEKQNLKWTIIFATIVSLQFFAGRVQYFYYTILALIIYASLKLFKKENLKSIKYFALSIIIFLGVVSIQLIPMLEIAPYTIQNEDTNAATYEFSAQESVPPKHFLTLIMPEFFGKRSDNSYWGAPSRLIDMYFGVLPLLLAILTIFYIKDKRKTAFIALTIFSVFFALGSYTPFYWLLYKLIPGVGLFKVPGRYLMIFTFAMAGLAALGVDGLLKINKIKITKITKIIGAIAILTILAGTNLFILKPYLLNYGEKLLQNYYYIKYANTPLVQSHTFEFFQQKIPIAFKYVLISIAKLGLIITGTYFVLKKLIKTKSKSTVTTLLISIVIIDLLFLSNVYDWDELKKTNYPGTESSIETLKQWDALADTLHEDKKLFRVYGFPQDIIVKNELHSIAGSDSMPLGYSSKYSDYIFLNLNKTGTATLLQLTNVKYILTDKIMPEKNYELINENLTFSHCRYGANKEFQLYETRDVLPRAYVVPEAKTLPLEAHFTAITSGSLLPKEEVLITEEISLKGGQEYKEATITSYTPNKITLNVELEKPGFLVISETYYPGWKAYDNNKETTIYQANYIMRTIYLEAGEHNIEFVYAPTSYKLGKSITLVTLTMILFGLIFLLILKSKKTT